MVLINGARKSKVTRTAGPAVHIASPRPSATATQSGASANVRECRIGSNIAAEARPAPIQPVQAEPPAASGREAPRKSRAEAARENGRKSRGPVTPEGKARSSQNALKHGLTARRVTINSEEDADWERFQAACHAELQPVGVVELSYADEFAASRWRLRRCLGIETVIFDDEFAHQENEVKKYSTLDDVGRTGLAFKKVKEDLNALGRYETRIRRAGERALANLLKLQSRRQSDKPGVNTPDPGGDPLQVPLNNPDDPGGDTLRVSPPAPEEPAQNEPNTSDNPYDPEGDTLRVSPPPPEEPAQNEPNTPENPYDPEGDTLRVSPPATASGLRPHAF